LTLKKPHHLKTMESNEAPLLDENTSRLYQNKIESRFSTDNETTTIDSYQSVEHGRLDFSATGSPTIAKTVKTAELHGKIIYATAHAQNTLAIATVTDVTNTSITISLRSISGTANFSSVTTDVVSVYYQIVGSSP